MSRVSYQIEEVIFHHQFVVSVSMLFNWVRLFFKLLLKWVSCFDALAIWMTVLISFYLIDLAWCCSTDLIAFLFCLSRLHFCFDCFVWIWFDWNSGRILRNLEQLTCGEFFIHHRWVFIFLFFSFFQFLGLSFRWIVDRERVGERRVTSAASLRDQWVARSGAPI